MQASGCFQCWRIRAFGGTLTTRLLAAAHALRQPIVLTNGQHEVKIYTVQNRGRMVYQLSFHEGGKRERKTFAKASVAKREAKLVLNRLAVNGHDAAELSTADMESYVVAKKHVEPTGLPERVRFQQEPKWR